MTRNRSRFVLAAALVVALAVPAVGQKRATHAAAARPAATPAAAAAPAALPDRKVPFTPGETLTYDISWSSYLTAGVATLAVKDKRQSGTSRAYYIVGEAKPVGLVAKLYAVYYKADTLLDSITLLPQRGSLYSQEGSRQRNRITRFDHSTLRADYEVKTATDVRSSLPLPRYTQDALSSVYALRAVPLKENSRLTMPVCDGGQIYRVQFAIGKIESVPIGSGTLRAYHITPTVTDSKGRSVSRPMALWLSADARQVPVKLRADLAVGSVNLTLR
jgi:hypothetical protein